jgi:hypothetical protein
VAIGVVLGYMGLLVFGAVISPGVGFFGHIVAMLPQIITEWSHAPAYGLLTWLLSSTLQRRAGPSFLLYRWPWPVRLCSAFGPKFSRHRFPDVRPMSMICW